MASSGPSALDQMGESIRRRNEKTDQAALIEATRSRDNLASRLQAQRNTTGGRSSTIMASAGAATQASTLATGGKTFLGS